MKYLTSTIKIFTCPRGWGEKSSVFTSNMSPQCGGYSRALFCKKLLSPPIPVGGEAVVTNDWCIKCLFGRLICSLTMVFYPTSECLHDVKCASKYNHPNKQPLYLGSDLSNLSGFRWSASW